MSKLGKIFFLISGIAFLVLLAARLIMQGWIDYLYAPLFIGLVSLIMAIVVDIKLYLEFLTMRTTKHGMNMGVMIVLTLVLLTAVNFLGVRYDKTFDFTKEKLNTLSDQSVSALKELKGELKIMVFYRGSDDKEVLSQIKQNFQIYLDASDKIKMSYINALTDVDMAKKYLNMERFAVVLDYKGQRVTVDEPYNEEKTTSAILKVTRKEPKKIYFITGHGERDIDNNEDEGLGNLAKSLRNDGYTVAKINLQNGDKLPQPPGVIAIIGPKSPFLDAEMDEFRKFAREGGHLFVAADPGEKNNVALFVKPLGFEFKNNYIINQFEDLNNLGPLAALGAEYDRGSEITKKFYMGGRVMGSIFMMASEVSRAPDATKLGIVFSDLVKSSSHAYVSNVPKTQPHPEHRAAVIGILGHGHLETPKEESENKQAGKPDAEFAMVLFGDSDFLDNSFSRFGANNDLALNSFAYLADDLGRISIRPKAAEATPLELTSTRQIIIGMAGIGLPLTLIILSGFFWFRRKNL